MVRLDPEKDYFMIQGLEMLTASDHQKSRRWYAHTKQSDERDSLWELEGLLAVAAKGIPVAVVRLFSRKKQVVILGNELECGDSCHSTIRLEKL